MKVFGVAAFVAWSVCLLSGLFLTYSNVNVAWHHLGIDAAFAEGPALLFLYVSFTLGVLLIAVSVTALHWLTSRTITLNA